MTFEKPAPLPIFEDLQGKLRTARDLPPYKERMHWTPNIKYMIVKAVEVGGITKDELLVRYKMSDAEFVQWQSDIKEFGRAGLRSTKIRAMRRNAQPSG